MENALTISPPFLPEIFAFLRKTAALTKMVFLILREIHARKAQIRVEMDNLFQLLSPLAQILPTLVSALSINPPSASAHQMQLGINFILRDVLSALNLLNARIKRHPLLNSSQYKKLKKYISALSSAVSVMDMELISRSDSPEIIPAEKFYIGSHVLRTPLRVFCQDDDGGKYISCLELPQIYGFGDTECEAMEMLDREILSLQEEVKSSDNISEEYQYAGELIDMVFGDA